MDKISVLTITQYSRRHIFKFLIQHILSQTIQPDEWVIVEGSQLKKDGIKNREIIQKYIKTFPNLNIIYIPWKKRTFSKMLNVGNAKCSGEFIIQMEDDDYYPPSRIEHAVTKLKNNPDIEIAGLSSIYMYDIINDILIKSPHFGDGHSCNNALAYKRSYLKKNKYNDNKFSVEPSFLNNYIPKIIQLDINKTIINIIHPKNTISRNIILNNWKKNKMYYEIDKTSINIHAINFLQKYKNILSTSIL